MTDKEKEYLEKLEEIERGNGRKFKPGIYTHFKKGTKYLAYDDTIDEVTGLPRISYFAIDKPEKKWNREQKVFLAGATKDPKVNKTGQEFKFEFYSSEYPLINSETTKFHEIETRMHIFKHLHVTDNIRLITKRGQELIGKIEMIGQPGLIIDLNEDFMNIKWYHIKELYKIYGGL